MELYKKTKAILASWRDHSRLTPWTHHASQHHDRLQIPLLVAEHVAAKQGVGRFSSPHTMDGSFPRARGIDLPTSTYHTR